MARPHKFTPGRKITQTADAVEIILMGLYVYFNHKPMHPGWMQNWSISQLRRACGLGQLRLAELNEEHPDNFKEVA